MAHRYYPPSSDCCWRAGKRAATRRPESRLRATVARSQRPDRAGGGQQASRRTLFGGTELSDAKPSCRRLRSSNLSRGGKRDHGEPKGEKGEADYLLTGSQGLRTSTEPQEATNRIRRAETESRTTAAAAAGDDGKESALAPSSSSPAPTHYVLRSRTARNCHTKLCQQKPPLRPLQAVPV